VEYCGNVVPEFIGPYRGVTFFTKSQNYDDWNIFPSEKGNPKNKNCEREMTRNEEIFVP